MKKSVMCILTTVLFFVLIGTAEAIPVTVNFHGTVNIQNDLDGVLAASGIQSGVTEVLGEIIYDTDTIPTKTTSFYSDYAADSFTLTIGDNFSYSATSSRTIVRNDNTDSSGLYDFVEWGGSGNAFSNYAGSIWMDASVWWKDDQHLSLDSLKQPTLQDLINFNVTESYFRINGGPPGSTTDAWIITASPVTWDIVPVPEPTSLLLLGSGLLGVITLKRKCRK